MSDGKEIFTEPDDFLGSLLLLYEEEAGGDTDDRPAGPDLLWEEDLCLEEKDLLLEGLLRGMKEVER